MKMFKYLSLLSICMYIICSCSGGSSTEGTHINGRVTLDNYEGRYVYLEVTDGSNVISDSSLVKNGKFSFVLNDSVPSVYNLVLKENDDDVFAIILPVVSEKGNISVLMGEYVRTEGTPLNNNLQDFLLAKSHLNDNSQAVSIEKFKSDFANLVETTIQLNKGNVIANYLYTNYIHLFSTEQLERVRTISQDDNNQ